MNDEVWKLIVGYEGYYEVSSLGNIRSVNRTVLDKNGRRIQLRGRMLKPEKSGYNRNYRSVNLSKEHVIVHREVHVLVAGEFLGEKPDGTEICHNDGVGYHNAVDNLRYDTPSSNSQDARGHGLLVVVESSQQSKLTELQVKEIRERHKNGTGKSLRRLGLEYGVGGGAIRKIVLNIAWKHV